MKRMTYDHISHFDYELPQQLIAQYPLPERTASRLLQIDTNSNSMLHGYFTDLVNVLQPNDLLVINNTKVFPARLYGRKESGGRIECLVERVLSSTHALVHLKSSKSPKIGMRLIFQGGLSAMMIDRHQDLFLLAFDCEHLLDILEVLGHIPLPPYIDRKVMETDKSRYQTVYAAHRGAIAAPTAGLHFTTALLNKIQEKGIHISQITLHVGAGTFQPLRVDRLDAHKMHQEYLEVSQETCEAIYMCRERKGRVVAVGTTTLRALETAAKTGVMLPFKGNTDLFIRPGYQFHGVDILITNFHLPKSTLLMLVTAFGGYDLVMAAYKKAVEAEYRFYSYGDAMLIERSLS